MFYFENTKRCTNIRRFLVLLYLWTTLFISLFPGVTLYFCLYCLQIPLQRRHLSTTTDRRRPHRQGTVQEKSERIVLVVRSFNLEQAVTAFFRVKGLDKHVERNVLYVYFFYCKWKKKDTLKHKQWGSSTLALISWMLRVCENILRKKNYLERWIWFANFKHVFSYCF